MFSIRLADKNDSETIYKFIFELAVYEKMEDQVMNSPEIIEKIVFNNNNINVFLCEEDNIPVGFALFYETYSTFTGYKGIHLEDLYVQKDKRGLGYGSALLKALADYTVKGGYTRLEWNCLDWNKPSNDFYESTNAERLDSWLTYRLSGETLSDFSKK